METSSHPRQRKLRNFLLDPKFQLRYANFAALSALALALVLGSVLWRTSVAAIETSRVAVGLGEKVVQESRKVSEVVRMNIVQDPAYADEDALRSLFEADAEAQARGLEKKQAELRGQSDKLAAIRVRVAIVLIGALTLLVVALWIGAIVLTHKVAGPIYKMRRQLRELEAGNLRIPVGLRKGDQLESFFGAFNDMVLALRERQAQEIAQLDRAIEGLEAQVQAAQLNELRELRAEMQASLDA